MKITSFWTLFEIGFFLFPMGIILKSGLCKHVLSCFYDFRLLKVCQFFWHNNVLYIYIYLVRDGEQQIFVLFRHQLLGICRRLDFIVVQRTIEVVLNQCRHLALQLDKKWEMLDASPQSVSFAKQPDFSF